LRQTHALTPSHALASTSNTTTRRTEGDLSNMSFSFIDSPGACFVRWGDPTARDVAQTFLRVRAAADTYGMPVAYVSYVPATTPPPHPSVCAYLSRIAPRLSTVCSSVYFVLEGSGFHVARKRGVLLTAFSTVQQHRKYVVCRDCGEVYQHAPSQEMNALRLVLIRARETGLWDGGLRRRLPSTSRPPSWLPAPSC